MVSVISAVRLRTNSSGDNVQDAGGEVDEHLNDEEIVENEEAISAVIRMVNILFCGVYLCVSMFLCIYLSMYVSMYLCVVLVIVPICLTSIQYYISKYTSQS